MDKYASEEDKKQLIDFDPINLSKQVEELQGKVKTLHLETIGAKVDIDKLNNKAKKFAFSFFNFSRLKLLNILLFLNRDLLYDNLNSLKKELAKNSDKKGGQSESSIVFKLFTDLEASDLAKANKVNLKQTSENQSKLNFFFYL